MPTLFGIEIPSVRDITIITMEDHPRHHHVMITIHRRLMAMVEVERVLVVEDAHPMTEEDILEVGEVSLETAVAVDTTVVLPEEAHRLHEIILLDDSRLHNEDHLLDNRIGHCWKSLRV